MIEIERLNLTVGNFALREVSLSVAAGEYFVLLGPTGSGKTLLIESICGLNRIDSGTIRVGGTDVTRLEPRNRHVGYLPQDYALFPHKSVRGNIGFGLARRGVLALEHQSRVDQLMEHLGVSHLADRLPRRLSGGEKQRVALARALAVRPKVLLLDEPVSALDEQTRDRLCRRLKQLQQETETTAIHVCHNFAEMLAVADRVGIIHEGRIVQVGTPREILRQPNSALVARFVQGGNVFPATAEVRDGRVLLSCRGGLRLQARLPEEGNVLPQVTAMVRPENVALFSTPQEDRPLLATALEGTVRDVVDLGPLVRVDVACGQETVLRVSLGRKEYDRLQVRPGDPVWGTIDTNDVHLMSE